MSKKKTPKPKAPRSWGLAKVRCIGCERVTKDITQEHYWPKWLAKRANLGSTGVQWIGGEYVGAGAATVPLCGQCNHALGAELEGPVSNIFISMEAGEGLTDKEAEYLVRWLWKFEGLAWMLHHPDQRYSQRWTVRERVLGDAINSIRSILTLGVSFIYKNDEDFDDLPVGIDSGIGGQNSIFVSGVFCKTAIMVTLRDFAYLIPPQFSRYEFPIVEDGSGKKRFFPKTGFQTSSEAIEVTKAQSIRLTLVHEHWAALQSHRQPLVILPNRRRVELPMPTVISARRKSDRSH